MSVTSEELRRMIDELRLIYRRRERWLKGTPRSEIGQAMALLVRAVVHIESVEQEAVAHAQAIQKAHEPTLTPIERMIDAAVGYRE